MTTFPCIYKQPTDLAIFVAVAVQLFNISRILLASHEPSLGGLERYLEQQKLITRCVENICGIALTLKDNASCLMSSQALFIGMWVFVIKTDRTDKGTAGTYTQGINARKAVLGLLASCRERSGWPVKPLGTELQQIWDKQDSL